jgi:hypothetical protein
MREERTGSTHEPVPCAGATLAAGSSPRRAARPAYGRSACIGSGSPKKQWRSFETRIIAAAKAARVKNVMIGGLCSCYWKEPGSFEAYINGPDFPEVPPEEKG